MDNRVVLIYPSFAPGIKPKYSLPPMGVLYLATLLESQGIKANVIDGEVKGLTIDQMVEMTLKEKPDLVGVSVMTSIFPTSLEIIKRIKQRDNSIKICFGGPHINSTGVESFEFTTDLDFIILGEGEYTLLELVNSLNKEEDFQKIDGLVYLDKNKEIKCNRRREFITNLDSLSFPDLNLIVNTSLDSYRVPYSTSKRVSSLIANRGCPYRCIFCDASNTHGKKTRFRSPKNVADEFEMNYDKYRITHITIKDSTLTLNKKWLLQFCNELQERKLNMEWRCNTRVDKIDKETVQAMKKAGCKSIALGVESGSQIILNNIKKDITILQSRNAFKIIHQAGIETTASFMIGNPGETEDTVKQTIKLSKELDPNFAMFFIATAYPRTELYEYGIKNCDLDPKWYLRPLLEHKSDFYGGVLEDPLAGCLKIKNFDSIKLKKKAFREFYFRPYYIIKTLKILIKNPHYISHLTNAVPSLTSWVYKK